MEFSKPIITKIKFGNNIIYYYFGSFPIGPPPNLDKD